MNCQKMLTNYPSFLDLVHRWNPIMIQSHLNCIFRSHKTYVAWVFLSFLNSVYKLEKLTSIHLLISSRFFQHWRCCMNNRWLLIGIMTIKMFSRGHKTILLFLKREKIEKFPPKPCTYRLDIWWAQNNELLIS